VKSDEVKSCLESKEEDSDALDALKDTLEYESEYQIETLKKKSFASEKILVELEDKLKHFKEKLNITVKSNSIDER
jgi:hypothetical protein